MGLDCIPSTYPCAKTGTAVRNDEGGILCGETQSIGGCPWLTQNSKREMTGGQILGMFGADCWYRGKSGNAMLGRLYAADEAAAELMRRRRVYNSDGMYGDCGFYGDTTDAETGDLAASPEYLVVLAETMEGLTESYARLVENEPDAEEQLQQWAYAAWWCRFAAEYADGSIAWY